ncbi:MAG: SRPBCC domain-containing protein [Ferruginibacter sp.]
MKNTEFKISIAGSKKKVWETMLHPTTYKEWVNAAWPGSYFESEWREGNNLRFITEDGSGTLATLIEHKPYDYSVAKHIALLLPGGTEDRDSEVAKGWIGTTERYTFEEKKDTTELKVELTINPDFEKMFNDGWPKALAKLKEICEKSN